ncbi:MAG: late competence development ComFB family protein [Syntrophomonadaceae bacterium]|nr:late competence development ComFB family protein [Syntrophomonadaceae bacterium]
MKVKNIVEGLVWESLERVLDTKPDACKCDKCQADIVASALNHLPPKYVVTEMGETIARAGGLDHRVRTAVLVALAEAVELVTSRPRHE